MSPSNFKNKLHFGLNLFQELALDFTLLGNGKHLPNTILILYRRYLVPRFPDFILGFSLWFVACPNERKYTLYNIRQALTFAGSEEKSQ